MVATRRFRRRSALLAVTVGFAIAPLVLAPRPTLAAPAPTWTYESNVDSASVGCPIAPAGDVNGDGFADFLAGGRPGPRLFFGSPTGPFTTSPTVIAGYGPGAAGRAT